jgi:hypothetical protein
MYKFFLFFVTALFLLFNNISSTDAHLGNGPPFMKVNGVYSQTNPYNQGSSKLTMSWDTAPQKYLINKPITFTIDVPTLMSVTTIPLSFMKDVQFRWTVATGDNFEKKENKSTAGAAFTRTFTKPGSYLVIAEAKLPADTDYILINTIQVDVLPTADYKLPHASAYVGTHDNDPGSNVLLVSNSISDPSTKIQKYVWDLGDERLKTGATLDTKLERADTMGTETIFHRVIDGNGFIADVGFVVDKVGDKLRFDPYAPGKPLPVSVVSYDEAREHSSGSGGWNISLPQFTGVAVGVLLVAGVSWWVLFRRRK